MVQSQVSPNKSRWPLVSMLRNQHNANLKGEKVTSKPPFFDASFGKLVLELQRCLHEMMVSIRKQTAVGTRRGLCTVR